MKSIEAIVRVEKVNDVRDALLKNGFTAMSLGTVVGRGEQKERKYDQALGTEVTYDLFARTYILMLVEDNKVDEAIKIIEESAKTGTEGDGVIFVRPVEKAIKIRTGEELS
ncbi:MAG: nitrogen regulatory protein P-II [Candidatus Nitrosocaldaceae archaeon]|nr:MAG: nitrogen regulatory protein P-II [Candidatus Nitrosocaldaceae archaeon]